MPDIDPSFCNNYMLGKIYSRIGKPICGDKYTASGLRISYARVLIDVSAKEAQRRHVDITRFDGKAFVQRVNYE